MSKWLTHVKKTMKSEAGKKSSMGKKWFSHVLKTAKKTYHKKGGDPTPDVPSKDEDPTEKMPELPSNERPSTADPTAPGGRRRARKGGKTVRRARK
jgi:hypothetical protein